jgi:putative hydrolase of the HAD superfamily
MKIENSIRNIIFDFGGVIINISHVNLENAFRDLGVQNFENLFNKAVQLELFQNFETGVISTEEFRRQVRKLTNLNVTNEIFDRTWNLIIGDFPEKRINLLKKISKNYEIFLFSNTNIIHYDYYIEKFKREFGYDFPSLFRNTYWSFRMGKRKPDPDSFLEIIDEEKLIPEETLFIDDSLQNILAADRLGLKTIHIREQMDITELFDDNNMLMNF